MKRVGSFKLVDFKTLGDHRGSLISLEQNKNIPFEIKRVYYIFDTKLGVKRGEHAHKNLEQILVCVSGSCKVLLDDGKDNKKEFMLDNPDKGLYLKNMVWRTMSDFSENCVLMSLASNLYEEEDYIRDYDEFIKIIEEKNREEC